MTRSVRQSAAALLAAAFLGLPSASAFAAEPGWIPKPPRGQGDRCVADTFWMRRNHMTVLMHQRDATVHDGIRSRRFSLKGCIECHVVKGADGKPVTAASPTHFCRTCHDYAAVRMDCFECHASRPEADAAGTGKADAETPARADAHALARYLRSIQP
jgi:predicted CXXCH cytochrome family protein